MNAEKAAQVARAQVERYKLIDDKNELEDCRLRIARAAYQGEQSTICGYTRRNGWKCLSADNKKILHSEGFVTKDLYYDKGQTRVSW